MLKLKSTKVEEGVEKWQENLLHNELFIGRWVPHCTYFTMSQSSLFYASRGLWEFLTENSQLFIPWHQSRLRIKLSTWWHFYWMSFNYTAKFQIFLHWIKQKFSMRLPHIDQNIMRMEICIFKTINIQNTHIRWNIYAKKTFFLFKKYTCI